MSSGAGPPQDAGTTGTTLHRGTDPFYTNDDVAILHEIVVLAQERLPNLPERERLPTNALFGAYYETLPKLGLDADHDNRYARILFKIGGLGGAASLYERFEAILSRMGIEIEFDHEDQGAHYSPLEGTIPDLEREAEEDEHISRDRRRRNSESTLWDLEQRLPRRADRRRNSVSMLVEPYTPHIVRRHELVPAESQVPSQYHRWSIDDYEEDVDTSQQNVRAWLASRPGQLRPDRDRSVSAHKNVRLRQGSRSAGPDLQTSTRNPSIPSDDFLAPSELTAVTSAQDDHPSDVVLPQGRPSDQTLIELMNIKASIFRQQLVRTLSARIVILWRDSALQLQEAHEKLEVVALHQDRRALLTMVLAAWRKHALEKRVTAEEAETEKFFALLEDRTEQVMNSHLLYKAFSHWATCAAEEVERTAVARRHMLRWRTFNEWRAVTVVKELMVRRQVTRKFFSVWKRRHEEVIDNEGMALQKYEGNLVERIFREWVDKVRDIQATSWWADGLKMRELRRWRGALQDSVEDHIKADDQKYLQLMLSTWGVWRARIQKHASQDQQAVKFSQSSILSNSLRKWRREIRTIPPKLILQVDINMRLVRGTFTIWLHRARQETQAATVDRARILQEALTTWQYQVRFQMFQTSVNERVANQSIYKWTLASRKAVAKRRIDGRLKQNCLQNWVEKWKAAREQRWEREDQAETFAIQKARVFTLNRWDALTKTHQEREAIAHDLYASRVLKSVLEEWKRREEQVQMLQKWSSDAEFYFLTSKMLKRWRASTETSKHEKRKAAYLQVRRTVKMNLARDILSNWRGQAQHVMDLNAQAFEIRQNKDMIIGMNMFDQWRARTDELGELESLCWEKVLSKHLTAWRDRSASFRDLEMEAILNHQERQLSRALKKWSLQTLRQRSRVHYAVEVREKNVKRTFRRTFMYWHQRAAQMRPYIPPGPPEPETYPSGSVAREEAWSDIGDDDEWKRGIDDGNPSTPLPGYLNTPSKRMERVSAAAARFSSTTPRAPLSTPFERQLRAQYSEARIPTTRKGPGRSKLGMSEGFPDIGRRREGQPGNT